MKKFLLTAIASAAVFAAPAQALEVSSVSYTPAGYQRVFLTTTDAPVYTATQTLAGALAIKETGAVDSFVAYCIELTQNFGALPANYVEEAFTAKATDLGKAVQWMLNNGTFAPTTAAQSALNQAIIWEIVYEDSVSYSLASGDFTIANSLVPANNTFASFDFSAINSTAIHSSIAKLTNGKNQDLLVVTAVPEPSTYALMLAGLAGVGFLARRRRAD